MAAHDHLSTGLFHGTTAVLKPGDIIQPSTQVGHSPYKDLYGDVSRERNPGNPHSRGDHVYMHPDEHEAWEWAGNSTREGAEGGGPIPYAERSPRVYEVEPIGGSRSPDHARVPGGEMIYGERVTHRGLGARVIRENTIPKPVPGRAEVGPGIYKDAPAKPVQGELPGVNWRSQEHSYLNSGERNHSIEEEQTKIAAHQNAVDYEAHLDNRDAVQSRYNREADPQLPGMDKV
jgi:hypothetical protein